jgi:hypothetical protein
MSMNDPKDNPLIATLDRVPVQAVRLEVDGPSVRVMLLIDSTWRDVIVLDVFSGYTHHMVQTQYVPGILASPVAPEPKGGIYVNRPVVGGGREGEEMGGPLSPEFRRLFRELTTPPEERLTKGPGLEGVTAAMLKDADAQADAQAKRVEQAIVDAMVDDEIERHRETAARASEIYVPSELPRASVQPVDAGDVDRRTVERLKREQASTGPRTKGPKTKGGKRK